LLSFHSEFSLCVSGRFPLGLREEGWPHFFHSFDGDSSFHPAWEESLQSSNFGIYLGMWVPGHPLATLRANFPHLQPFSQSQESSVLSSQLYWLWLWITASHSRRSICFFKDST
jgi:hypothetical protein